MKPVMFRRAYPLIFGVLFLAVASAWAAEPKRNLAVAPGKPAAANETRVALVIGNSNYKSAPLKNPVNDAKAIADKLQGLGFKVTLKLDQDQKSMAEAIRVFGNQLKAGGAGLFYYAGHGMQVKGRNFLIPVDADIQNEDEVPYRSVDANEVLSKMETAKNRLNLMILDACRNNPFSRKFRSSSQGLAQMDAPSGTLVAFATAPGSVASDGTGKNGLYTQHLLANLGQPGLPVEQLFKRVRVGVMKDTRNAQVPWESSSLVGDFYFKPGTAAPTTTDPTAIELAYWESIKDSTSADDYKSYLKKYPNGQFADIAKRRALNPPKPSTNVASIAPTPATKPEPSPGATAGKVWKELTTGMEFVWIPKGCFQMGSPTSESGRFDNEHPHQVCIEGYWLSKYEVTNTQYRIFKPTHDSGQIQGNTLNGDTQPVVSVSWYDATAYAEWLSSKTGKTFRLPTEAEWEYAARAGTKTARYFGDDDASLCRHANVIDLPGVAYTDYSTLHSTIRKNCDDGYKVSAPVGRFTPNAFGLHDMLGNVWEWTASPYDQAYAGGEKRTATKDEGGRRVARGGSWNHFPMDARSAHRGPEATPDSRASTAGFRLARNP